MAEIINKGIAKEMMQIPGEVRGIALKSHQDFIIKERGRDGLIRLEKEMENLGFPVKYKEVKVMDFYPIGLEVIALLAIKQLFGFSDEKFEEIGIFQSKMSWIIKVFMRYFSSIDMVVKEAPNIWKRYYTVGSLKVVEYKKLEKRVVLRLENFKLHPLHCRHVKGYCENVVKMTVKKSVSSKEIKCPFLGDDFHEFVLTW